MKKAKEEITNTDVAAEQTVAGEVRDSRVKFNYLALTAIIAAFVAWVLLSFNGKIALAVSVFAFVCGCFGLKASTRSWRNTAITAIVASAVLMVVLTAVLIVVYVGLKSI